MNKARDRARTRPEKGAAELLNAFREYRSALNRFISRYLHNPDDIEDVAQEAFLRAWSARNETEILQPKSFLFRIARNVAVSELRQKSRQITVYIEESDSPDVLDMLAGDVTPEDETIARQRLGIHCEAVASLPTQCRRVYLMRKVYGMSHGEIAQRLGISVSTVEKHLIKGVEMCDRYVRARMDEGAAPSSRPEPAQRSGGRG